MIRKVAPVAGLLLAMVMPAVSAGAEPDRRITEGHELAVRRCSGCHAVEKEGSSPNPASPPFRMLGRDYPVETLDEALAEGISVGHAGMPDDPWEPAEIESFIAYLKSIAEPGRAMTGPPKHLKRVRPKRPAAGDATGP
jgi:mono/diheme cytochrome c family protein